MAKRKLTRKQQWQIEKVQTERLLRAQKKDDAITQTLMESDLGTEEPGLVIAHYGTQIDVEALQGEATGHVFRCKLRSNLGQLVTGDRVSWCQAKDNTGIVVAREERTSELVRPNKYGLLKPIAANVDQMVITIAPTPHPHTGLIDRYLVAAEASRIAPILLFNKTDLVTDDDALYTLLKKYQALGYPVVYASTNTQTGLDDLRTYLGKRITVFVGQSGVGKSSLVNVLLPNSDQRVNALSEYHQQGIHTTTTAKLFHWQNSGAIIDSPGIREFGLWEMPVAELAYCFREFRPFLGRCKFSNCSHEHEPQCALIQAVENNHIDPARMQSYFAIRDSANAINVHA